MAGEEAVREALIQFLGEHLPDTTIEDIDDIVLNYIVGILEDLGTEDCFDVDGFVEMMEAYIPGFAEFNNDKVCKWIFQLANQPPQGKENTPPGTLEVEEDAEYLPSGMLSTSAVEQVRGTLDEMLVVGNVEEEEEEKTDLATGGKDEGCDDDQIRMLLEMFPSSCVVDAKKCLTIAKGDMEHATQIMLDYQMDETHAATHHEIKTRKPAHRDDKVLKASILDKYGYVDTYDDEKEHKPAAPKETKKKMVRYINNQTVTTRGERFVDVKKPETEEMKKTYINLKPGRKYRFH